MFEVPIWNLKRTGQKTGAFPRYCGGARYDRLTLLDPVHQRDRRGRGVGLQLQRNGPDDAADLAETFGPFAAIVIAQPDTQRASRPLAASTGSSIGNVARDLSRRTRCSSNVRRTGPPGAVLYSSRSA